MLQMKATSYLKQCLAVQQATVEPYLLHRHPMQPNEAHCAMASPLSERKCHFMMLHITCHAMALAAQRIKNGTAGVNMEQVSTHIRVLLHSHTWGERKPLPLCYRFNSRNNRRTPDTTTLRLLLYQHSRTRRS
jgi:hypothetical protein